MSRPDTKALTAFTAEEVAYLSWLALWADGRHIQTGVEDYTLDGLAKKVAFFYASSTSPLPGKGL